MKIYASYVPYNNAWEILKSIAGQDIWVRAFACIDNAGWHDYYIQVLDIAHDSILHVKALPWHRKFGDGNHYEGNVYNLTADDIDLMQPVQFYATEDLIENQDRYWDL